MEVGITIKNYLKEHGITQAFLSKKTGIEKPKLNFALNGHRRLYSEEYVAICNALGVDINFFLKPANPGLPDERR